MHRKLGITALFLAMAALGTPALALAKAKGEGRNVAKGPPAQVSTIPEPGLLSLIGIGAVAGLIVRRRNRK